MDNLDDLFQDMLGELDVISQQLEDTSAKQEPKPERAPVVSSPPIVQQSAVPDVMMDHDLSAMLDDLTDWERNLAPSSSDTTSEGNEYQKSHGDFPSSQSSEMLSATYGMDVSPQFNTLKRSTTGGPSVTFGDDDITLESLEKDIENEKRNLDKARQLSAEELAALSPVMQELDDLVNDLSNIGFLQHSEDVFHAENGTPTVAKTPDDNPPFKSPKKPDKRIVSQKNYVSSTHQYAQTRNHSTSLSRGNSVSDDTSSSSQQHQCTVSNSTHLQRRESYEAIGTNKQAIANKPKPPPRPPVSSKPQLPKKPDTVRRNSGHNSPPAPVVKRQGSTKAPENLSTILERRLQLRGINNEEKGVQSNNISQSPTISEPPSVFESVPAHHHSSSHVQHNTTEVTSNPVPISKHSSMTSVVSSLSASSVASVRSDSSTESGSVEYSHSSSDRVNDKFVPDDIKNLLTTLQNEQKEKDLTPEAREERIRAEKMRIALEKLKEARIQKLVVKVFNKDDSSKTLLVDERMTTRSVIAQLLEKNHYDASVNWALVEELPSLYMERIFEEHELVTEMLAYWTRDTTNQVRFLERKDKYALFRNPQHYLLSVSDTEGQLAERQKQTLIEEFFSGRSGTGVPEVQGILYIKGESKSWSRKYCVLRTSGLYCSKSGEPKKGKKLADLQCLVMFEQVCVYLGRGWKKKYKSPTDYGFALKHPAIQAKSKHIRYYCCDDVRSLMRWIVGIRCAKYGKQLKDNFDRTNADMKSQGGTTTIGSIPTPRAPEESTSTEVSDAPRPSITNVFGGAWQRANQEEGQSAEGQMARTKSVWNSGKPKANSSNWWDLGAASELKDLVPDQRPGPTDGLPPEQQNADISNLPPPPMSMNVPPLTDMTQSRKEPPPPPRKPAKPIPPSKPAGDARFPPPPPPEDDMPPPPPLEYTPPPPPEDELPPPPPIEDDMPLPPPMPLASNQGMPRYSGNPADPAPVRLPFLPMFKNGNHMSKLRQTPPARPGPPPPPSKNFNSSNNKPSHRTDMRSSMQRKSSQNSPPRPPLTAYYISNTMKRNEIPPPSASDLPPPPEFITDLKDTFCHMSSSLHNGLDNMDDFPPPPPELLLNELKSRKDNGMVRKKSVKSAPPPPKRSANTRLSFKKS